MSFSMSNQTPWVCVAYNSFNLRAMKLYRSVYSAIELMHLVSYSEIRFIALD